MARAQGDYWQATRGPGHGDSRMPVLAPMDVPEAGRAHAARVPPRAALAQPGAPVRRLLPRAHVDVGVGRAARLRPAAGRRLDARRLHRWLGPRAPRVAARHQQAARRPRVRPLRALRRVRASHRGDARRHRAAGGDRLPRRRRPRRGRVRHARQVRARRGHEDARRRRASGSSGPSRCSRSRRSSSRARRRARVRSRSTRTTRARWSTTCGSRCSAARRCTSSAG